MNASMCRVNRLCVGWVERSATHPTIARAASRAVVFSISLLALLTGCRSRDADPFARFIPTAEIARKALTTGLQSWHDGHPAGLIEEASPKIIFVDSRHQSGCRLKAFEVLGEFPADKARGVAARVTLDDEDGGEPAVVRFVVLGIDPLWVYRQEDFEMFCHWMHPMTEAKASRDPRPEPAQTDTR